MMQNLDVLQFNGALNPSAWNFNITVPTPSYYAKRNIYIGSISCECQAKVEDNIIFSLTANISGAFSSDGRLEKTAEENLIKYQVPAILLPYLRGTITTFISNAGFGSVVIPLVNMNEVAKSYLKDKSINIIEE